MKKTEIKKELERVIDELMEYKLSEMLLQSVNETQADIDSNEKSDILKEDLNLLTAWLDEFKNSEQPQKVDKAETQKALDKKIKEALIELNKKAKQTLEALSYDEVLKCLEIKWIEPITKGILDLCDDKIDEFVEGILDLNERYKDTLKDIEQSIKVKSAELIADIEGLECSEESDKQALNELIALLKGSL